MSEVPVVRDPPPEADQVRPLVLVAVAVVSLAVGFLAVYLPGRGSEPPPSAPHARAAREPREAERERTSPVLAVAPRPAQANVVPAQAAAPASAAPAQPAEPPPEPEAEPPASAAPAPGAEAAEAGGRGVPVQAGDPYYWRCWDAGRDDPLPTEYCDRLRGFEAQLREQMGVVRACAGEMGSRSGKLSLGIELDFAEKQTNIWGGRSSTAERAADVAGCVRRRLVVELDEIRHAHSRYTIFVPLELGPP